MTVTIQQIPADQIVPGNNDRTTFAADPLANLAASIDRNGLAQPITVRATLTGFEIVAGERRFRAITELLGWTHVPAIVADYDDNRAAEVMLTENMARVDLNPIEEARAYQARLDAGSTIEDIATAAGVAEFRVRWRLDLLALDPRIAEMVGHGQLSAGVGRDLARLDPDRQYVALRAYRDQNLGATALTALVDRLEADRNTEAMFDPDDFMRVEEYVTEAQHQTAQRLSRRQLVELLTEAGLEVTSPELADRIARAVSAEPY